MRKKKNSFIFVPLIFLVLLLFYMILLRDSFEYSPLLSRTSFNISSIIRNIRNNNVNNDETVEPPKKKLAILVPFRNAFDELLVFIPKITTFLNQHKIPFKIFLINQIDTYRFNRGSLLNVGYLYVKNDSDYVILHDVDMYPVNSNISYEYPGNNSVFHVIPYYLHPNPQVNYEDYLGSILAVPNRIYEQVDGISNDFWGWGGEDDDFCTVLHKAKIPIERTSRDVGSRKNTFVHIHSKVRKRDTKSCNGQDRMTYVKRKPKSGLASTQYVIKNTQKITIDGGEATLLNVELKCDISKTPWCNC